MSITYFKPRDRFDFAKDTLDIGNPLSWKRSTFLKHFFKRVLPLVNTALKNFTSVIWSIIWKTMPMVTKKSFLRTFGN